MRNRPVAATFQAHLQLIFRNFKSFFFLNEDKIYNAVLLLLKVHWFLYCPDRCRMMPEIFSVVLLQSASLPFKNFRFDLSTQRPLSLDIAFNTLNHSLMPKDIKCSLNFLQFI